MLLITTYLLALGGGLSLIVICFPRAKAGRLLKVASAAMVLALAMDALDGLSVLVDGLVPLMAAAALLVPGVFLARAFGRIDMIAVLFHREFGLQGANMTGLWSGLGTAVLACLLPVLAVAALAGRLATGATFVWAAVALLLGMNPFLRFVAARLMEGSVRSVLSDRFVAPALAPEPRPRPDLLVVYLEGLDRRFQEREIYGDLCHRLNRFAKDGVNLTGIGQIAGTGWSLAGMVASQSGVPITPRGLDFSNGFHRIDRFMPSVPFLGDVLAARGYRSHYVVGGDADFGGIEAMYRSHGIAGITDRAGMERQYPADEYAAARSAWCVDDQMVFDAATRQHIAMLATPNPLALIVETIGPHGPKGILSRKNSPTGKAMLTLNIARTVACLIDETLDFVEAAEARSRALGRDLRVVLLSDHLNHTAHLLKGSAGYAGRNTVILAGNPAFPGQVIDREGSMIDVFPTLLDWLGWTEDHAPAGLGQSLFGSTPTLVEEFGIPVLDRMIVSDAGFAARVWGKVQT